MISDGWPAHGRNARLCTQHQSLALRGCFSRSLQRLFTFVHLSDPPCRCVSCQLRCSMKALVFVSEQQLLMIQTSLACFTAEEQAAIESAPSTTAVARQYDALIRRHGPFGPIRHPPPFHEHTSHIGCTLSPGNLAAFPPIHRTCQVLASSGSSRTGQDGYP